MMVTMAMKSMCDAPKAAGPFGHSSCPAAALRTSVPTIYQNKLLPTGLGSAAEPHPTLWGRGAHGGCVTAQLWGQQPCPCRQRGSAGHQGMHSTAVADKSLHSIWMILPIYFPSVRDSKDGEVEGPTSLGW